MAKNSRLSPVPGQRSLVMLALCATGLFFQLLPPRAAAQEDANLEKREAEAKLVAKIRQTQSWRFVNAQLLAVIRDRASTLHGGPMTVRGRVTDAAGKPVSQALVILRKRTSFTLLLSWAHGPVLDAFAYTWTDDDGYYEFVDQATPWTEPIRSVAWSTLVLAPGHAIAAEYHPQIVRRLYERVVLQRPHQIEGTVSNPDGTPAENFAVHLLALIDRPHRQGRYFCGLFTGELYSWTVTDAQGKFYLDGLPPRMVARIGVTPPYRHTNIEILSVATTNDLDPTPLKVAGLEGEVFPINESPVEIKLAHDYASVREPLPSQIHVTGPASARQSGEIRLLTPFGWHSLAIGTNTRLPHVISERGLLEVKTAEDACPWQAALPGSPSPRAGGPKNAVEVSLRPTQQVVVRVTDSLTHKGISDVRVAWKSTRPSLFGREMPTDSHGRRTFTVPICDGIEFSVGGRCYGYTTPYDRVSTNTQEPVPRLNKRAFTQVLSLDELTGDGPVNVSFSLAPVAPTDIHLQRPDGRPADAYVVIHDTYWNLCRPLRRIGGDGNLRVALRPVIKQCRITAYTRDGLVATQLVDLNDAAAPVVMTLQPGMVTQETLLIDGNPVEGETLEIRCKQQRDLPILAVTDTQGHFSAVFPTQTQAELELYVPSFPRARRAPIASTAVDGNSNVGDFGTIHLQWAGLLRQ